MLKNAIERAQNEQVENIKVCVELKSSIYKEIKQSADEHDLSIENICKSIIEINVENEQSSNSVENPQKEDMNIWIISSKYQDAEQDFTQQCLDNNQIRVGWYQKNLTNISQKDRDKILEQKEAGAKTALTYFFNAMKKGDLVIMKEGKSKIHAIVQISSKYGEDTEGFFYREIRKILVVPYNRSQKIANIYAQYFQKNLNMTTLYRKSISKIDFLAFILNSSMEVNQ